MLGQEQRKYAQNHAQPKHHHITDHGTRRQPYGQQHPIVKPAHRQHPSYKSKRPRMLAGEGLSDNDIAEEVAEYEEHEEEFAKEQCLAYEDDRKQKEKIAAQESKHKAHRHYVDFVHAHPDLITNIYYSKRYYDDEFEYRHVIVPKELYKEIPDDLKGRLLREAEWRALGIVQSLGWVHYEIHQPEPHVFMFKREKYFQVKQDELKLHAQKVAEALEKVLKEQMKEEEEEREQQNRYDDQNTTEQIETEPSMQIYNVDSKGVSSMEEDSPSQPPVAPPASGVDQLPIRKRRSSSSQNNIFDDDDAESSRRNRPKRQLRAVSDSIMREQQRQLTGAPANIDEVCRVKGGEKKAIRKSSRKVSSNSSAG